VTGKLPDFAGDQVEIDPAAGFFELGPETNGVATYNDGSELVFEGVENIEW